MKLCLVEDDLDLGRSLQLALREGGYEVLWVRRASDARYWVEMGGVDALLLDLGLPDANGMDLLRVLRGLKPELPILVITARDAIEDRLSGLDGGADDYLVKPFVPSELMARLRAVLRRSGGLLRSIAPAQWQVREIWLDTQRRRVKRGEEELRLTRTEFDLLLALMQQADRLVSRRELVERALPGTQAQTLDIHISNLRKKLGEGYIHTIRGVGFMMECEAPA
ncbi:response regulator transcription factor [Roseateles sp. DAIF2]|uniref:response regulator transcription factor n=1 Tax=Roseateles sp. DAIF2 TaxID=2714952 RepID=UPI0018A283B1|nr:response regulator transcription factor [Roseateles sp. DAIF2]QPF71974.1 response regulator transcription factor [Roseateles sp. DAIF2]